MLNEEHYSGQVQAFLHCYNAFCEIEQLTDVDETTTAAWNERTPKLSMLAEANADLGRVLAEFGQLTANSQRLIDNLTRQFAYKGALQDRQHTIESLRPRFADFYSLLHHQGEEFPHIREKIVAQFPRTPPLPLTP